MNSHLRHRRVWVAAACFALLALADMRGSLAHATDVPEPLGYRMKAFRADVPKTLAGATVIGTKEAEALWRRKQIVFIDVLQRIPKPANLPEDTVWRDKKRHNIPGSYWLPNVGFGRLPPSGAAYFRDHLHRLTQGDPSRAIVFYCLDRCWMSWNAAKRAMEYGYSNVHWYPQGTDGWSAASLPLEEKLPEK